MIDMTKFDFSKFDAAKLLNPDTVLDNLEDQAATATGYITDAKVRGMISTVNSATFAFTRAQIEATKNYADSVKHMIETLTKTHTNQN